MVEIWEEETYMFFLKTPYHLIWYTEKENIFVQSHDTQRSTSSPSKLYQILPSYRQYQKIEQW